MGTILENLAQIYFIKVDSHSLSAKGKQRLKVFKRNVVNCWFETDYWHLRLAFLLRECTQNIWETADCVIGELELNWDGNIGPEYFWGDIPIVELYSLFIVYLLSIWWRFLLGFNGQVLLVRYPSIPAIEADYAVVYHRRQWDISLQPQEDKFKDSMRESDKERQVYCT